MMEKNKEIPNLVNSLKEKNKDWETVVLNLLKQSCNEKILETDDYDKEIENTFYELLEAIIRELNGNEASDASDFEKILNDVFTNKELIEILEERLKYMTKNDPFEELRKIENENQEYVKYLYNFLFDNIILRFDDRAFDKYKDFGFSTDEEFTDMAQEFMDLVYYCIENYLSYSAIIETLKAQTGLNGNSCEFIAQIIDANFEKLKLNYIIDKLSNIEEVN